MVVRRVVANIAATDAQAAQAFYGELLGMEIVMGAEGVTAIENVVEVACALSAESVAR